MDSGALPSHPPTHTGPARLSISGVSSRFESWSQHQPRGRFGFLGNEYQEGATQQNPSHPQGKRWQIFKNMVGKERGKGEEIKKVTPVAVLARRTSHLAGNRPHNAFAEEQQTLCLCKEPEDGSKPESASTEVSPG